jgi:outer membrane PBP1 activator LpoA protein
MCEPTTMAILSAASKGMEFMEAQQQARQQQIRYDQNRIAAAQARDLKIQSLNQRAIQESEAAGEAKQKQAIEALEKRERGVVAAGEAGVTGSSVDILLADYTAQRLRGETTINRNLENVERQIELQKMGASAEAETRINSMPQGTQPSFLAAAISAAASGYATYKQYEVEPAGKYNSPFGSSSTTRARTIAETPEGL